jgi:hypothetical protein
MQHMILEVASIILWMNDGQRDEGLGCESKKCQSAENHNRDVLAGEWFGGRWLAGDGLALWREMVWKFSRDESHSSSSRRQAGSAANKVSMIINTKYCTNTAPSRIFDHGDCNLQPNLPLKSLRARTNDWVLLSLYL